MAKHRNLSVAFVLALFVCAAGFTSGARAQGDIRPYETVTTVEGWDGVDYVQYDGLFCMEADTPGQCESLVPYRITTPANAEHGNGAVLVEPGHFVQGIDAWWLGHDFLLSRGFTHAGIGYSTYWNRIAVPHPEAHVLGQDPCPFFTPCEVVTDDSIIREFAIALAEDPDARDMIGNNARFRYLTGFSDSSGPVKRLIADGADGVFDFALPMTTGGGTSPLAALGVDGDYDGVVIVVNSEFDDRQPSADALWDEDGIAADQYRYYVVPETPHVVDHYERLDSPTSTDFADQTTPAHWQPELRARFWQGHRWVRSNRRRTPPPSTRLARADNGEILVDGNGNTYVVDATGEVAPQPPYVALDEADFLLGNTHPIAGALLGRVESVAQVEDCSPDAVCLYDTFEAYFGAFVHAVEDYKRYVGLMEDDADDMIIRAGLCFPLTYTETYLYEYDSFVALEPCDE